MYYIKKVSNKNEVNILFLYKGTFKRKYQYTQKTVEIIFIRI